MILRCPHCGGRVPPPKPLIRVCAGCGKSIDRHHKYETVRISDKPPRYEFRHRHCDDPEAYLTKRERKAMERTIRGRKRK